MASRPPSPTLQPQALRLVNIVGLNLPFNQATLPSKLPTCLPWSSERALIWTLLSTFSRATHHLINNLTLPFITSHNSAAEEKAGLHFSHHTRTAPHSLQKSLFAGKVFGNRHLGLGCARAPTSATTENVA